MHILCTLKILGSAFTWTQSSQFVSLKRLQAGMLSRSDAKIADWVEKGKIGAPQDRFQNQWPNCLGHSVGGRGLCKVRAAPVDRTTCCLITPRAGLNSAWRPESSQEGHAPCMRLGNQKAFHRIISLHLL